MPGSARFRRRRRARRRNARRSNGNVPAETHRDRSPSVPRSASPVRMWTRTSTPSVPEPVLVTPEQEPPDEAVAYAEASEHAEQAIDIATALGLVMNGSDNDLMNTTEPIQIPDRALSYFLTPEEQECFFDIVIPLYRLRHQEASSNGTSAPSTALDPSSNDENGSHAPSVFSAHSSPSTPPTSVGGSPHPNPPPNGG